MTRTVESFKTRWLDHAHYIKVDRTATIEADQPEPER
jgi:hypothetical protein